MQTLEIGLYSALSREGTSSSLHRLLSVCEDGRQAPPHPGYARHAGHRSQAGADLIRTWLSLEAVSDTSMCVVQLPPGPACLRQEDHGTSSDHSFSKSLLETEAFPLGYHRDLSDVEHNTTLRQPAFCHLSGAGQKWCSLSLKWRGPAHGHDLINCDRAELVSTEFTLENCN